MENITYLIIAIIVFILITAAITARKNVFLKSAFLFLPIVAIIESLSSENVRRENFPLSSSYSGYDEETTPDFKSRGERDTYNVFKKLFPDHKIEVNTRPDWLKNPETNYNLEMDGYLPALRIAYEFDGRQHREYTPDFHKTKKDFHNQIRRDAFKTYGLWANGIDLIRIPDRCYNEIMIEKHIRWHYAGILKKHGIDL